MSFGTKSYHRIPRIRRWHAPYAAFIPPPNYTLMSNRVSFLSAWSHVNVISCSSSWLLTVAKWEQSQGCVRGLTVRDRYQDRNPRFRNETDAEALIAVNAVVSRPGRRDRDHAHPWAKLSARNVATRLNDNRRCTRPLLCNSAEDVIQFWTKIYFTATARCTNSGSEHLLASDMLEHTVVLKTDRRRASIALCLSIEKCGLWTVRGSTSGYRVGRKTGRTEGSRRSCAGKRVCAAQGM